MAEILLRVADKINTNSIYLDAWCTKRGDVIVVQDDGWPWGSKEVNNPDWVVLQLPLVNHLDIDYLIDPERLDPILHPLRQRRGHFIDITLLPPGLGNQLDTGGKVINFGLSLAILQTAIVVKTPLADPVIIG